MIKNYNFNISEEEKRQILNLHESRTKRHYLINEQQKTPFNDAIEKANVIKIQTQLGFTGADLDGKLGPKTLAAITAKLTGTSGASGTGGTSGSSAISGTGGTSGSSAISGTGGTSGSSAISGTGGTSGSSPISGTDPSDITF